LKADNGTEGHARIQVRAPGLVEPAAHFGETEGDECNKRCADQVREHAPDTRQAVDSGREAEDTCPDYAVDGQGHEVPSPDPTNQPLLRYLFHLFSVRRIIFPRWSGQ